MTRVFETPADVARGAADLIASLIAAKADATLLVATGTTPLPTYAELAERALDARRVCAVQLDEYLGVSDSDPRSLYGWMKRVFTKPLGIERVIRFDATAADPLSACARYDEEVRAAGGVDLAILGLGPNGHLGFNEPPADATAPTRVVTLSEESLQSNARYWPGARVPPQAFTAGMDVILAARRCLLLVSGAHKREVLARALRGPVSPDVPASYLQTAHLTVMADRAAVAE